MKVLKEEKARLTVQKNELYESYSSIKTRHHKMQAIRHNVYLALDSEKEIKRNMQVTL